MYAILDVYISGSGKVDRIRAMSLCYCCSRFCSFDVFRIGVIITVKIEKYVHPE